MTHMPQRPFRSIASVLIRRTIVLAVLCMLLVFGVQSWLLRAQHQKQFEMAINDVANTSVPLLAVALWDIETQAIAAQLQRIAQKPEIGYARLQAAGGQRFEAGNPALLAQGCRARLPSCHPSPPRVHQRWGCWSSQATPTTCGKGCVPRGCAFCWATACSPQAFAR